MATLAAEPLRGAAPLAVTFKGGSPKTFFGGIQIDFGDGQEGAFCGPGSACRDVAVTHTFAKSGVYTVNLMGTGEGQRAVLASVTVTVD